MKHKMLFRIGLGLIFMYQMSAFATGRLKGSVVDSSTNEMLVGADVVLQGTSIGAATDIEGNYVVNAIPPGKYIVKCSYIGYKEKQTSVIISNDKTSELNFRLSVNVVRGKEVVVIGQALGQAAAINQQINSDRIVDVVSQEKIQSLPDANAAEALGRLPGISVVRTGGEASQIILGGLSENFATITMDGVKLAPTDADDRGVDLSTISQGSLAGIVVTKAITSDMDGDAIAGNVNFVTKTAPEKREIQVNGYGTYSALDKTDNQYNFYGKYGERFFNNLLGVQLFGNIERKNRSSEQYNVSYDQTLKNNTDYQISDFQITYTPEIRTRGGAQLLLDFKTPDNGLLKFDADYNRTERRLSSIDRDYPIENGDVTYDFLGEDINTDIKDFALEGENNLYNWQLNWHMSYTESNSENPYNNAAHFDEPSTSENGKVISGMLAVPVQDRKGTSYQDLIPYALNNFGLAYETEEDALTNSNLDFEKTLSLDIKKSYNFFNLAGEFKFGGKYISTYHRRDENSSYGSYYNGVGNGFYNYVKLPNGSVVPKDFAGYGFSNLAISNNLILLTNFINSSTREIFNKYLLNPIEDADIMRNWYNMNIYGYNPLSGLSEYRVNYDQNGTNYNLDEDVSAGYIMNTLNMGTFATFIAGVRVESDNDRYAALVTRQAISQYASFTDTASYHKESIVLPNFQLILRPTDFMNIRLSAYRGLSRPDFNYRLPTYIFSTNYLILGNTNLKNEDAWNFNTNVQFYGNSIGLLSVSAFYKKINNEVEYLNAVPIQSRAFLDSLGIVYSNGEGPSATSISLTYPYNSSKPTLVWGFELEHQINFRFLPGLLSNIILSYNLSFIKTQTYTPIVRYVEYYVQLPGFPFPTEETKVTLSEIRTRMLNSPQGFGNIVLGYDIGNFSGRLSYFYQGDYYNGFSADGYSNNIQKAFGRLDLALKQGITDFLSIGLDVDNINNEKEGTELQNTTTGWTLDASNYEYGTTADLWLRVSL
jgi:TonB-dependent receptor